MLPAMHVRALIPALLALAVLAGCGSSSERGRLSVVATTTQLGDIVRDIAGPDVDVHQILKPNSDPHDYEPRPDDVRATAGADLVVTSGKGLDHWVGDVIEQSGSDATVLDAGAAVPEPRGDDPHWWHDPRNVEAAARTIASALAGKGVAGAQARGQAYADKVAALDRRITGCIDAIPAGERKLVTDHDAFGYFARRYGLRVVGAVIPSQTTQAQPSAGDIAALVRTIRRERVRAVFPESSVNAKLAEAVARQTGARSDLELYGDTLGPAGSSGATYLTMEAANADAIVRGLTGGRRGCRAG